MSEENPDEIPPEFDEILGGASSKIPFEMLKYIAQFAEKAIVPDANGETPEDILTRADLTSKRARTGCMVLLKAIYPYGPGVKKKREYDAQRYGIDVPEINLNYLTAHILGRDFPITLSTGDEKSHDRVIKFFDGVFANTIGLNRGSQPRKEQGRK